jgi:hypothetical protein
MPWILSKGGESVFGAIAVCLYFALNACLGLYFHLSVRHETYLKPKFAELLVYVLAASLFGLPIVMVVASFGLAAGLMHKESLT